MPTPYNAAAAELDMQLRDVVTDLSAMKVPSSSSGTQAPEVTGGALPWRAFEQRHPYYDAGHWEELRALYAGGPRLLRNPDLMKRLFPAHNAEAPKVHKDRSSRACYFPYAGTIVDHLVAGLGADPIRVVAAELDDKGDAAPLGPWWMEWFTDVSPKGGRTQTLNALAMESVREALITRRAWLLVDLPQTADEYMPDSQLDQERQGLLDPYVIAIDPEYVIDWQDDANGELEWALLCDSEHRRESIAADRSLITKTFTLFDRVGWKRWRTTYNPARPPATDDPVAFLDEGVHPFGKVPLVRVELPEGLWAMGKLESLAREHFNKRSAVSWAEFKSLFAVLYEFMGPEEPSMVPISQAQQDPNRAVVQTRGQGYTQERGSGDRAEFIGPDVAPFAEARKSCDEIMREMHRVMFSMALSVDTDSAGLNRSGESKAQDRAVAAVILRALGQIIRDAIREVVDFVALARGDGQAVRVTGAEQIDRVDVTAAVKDAVELLNGVPIKSTTFKRAYLYRIYKLVMGDELTEEQLADIRGELADQINAEDMLLEDTMALAPPGPGPGPNDQPDPAEEDPPSPEDVTPPSRPRPKPSGRMIGTM